MREVFFAHFVVADQLHFATIGESREVARRDDRLGHGKTFVLRQQQRTGPIHVPDHVDDAPRTAATRGGRGLDGHRYRGLLKIVFLQAFFDLLRHLIRGQSLRLDTTEWHKVNRPANRHHVDVIETVILVHGHADADAGHNHTRFGVGSGRCIRVGGAVGCATGRGGKFLRRQDLYILVRLAPNGKK